MGCGHSVWDMRFRKRAATRMQRWCARAPLHRHNPCKGVPSVKSVLAARTVPMLLWRVLCAPGSWSCPERSVIARSTNLLAQVRAAVRVLLVAAVTLLALLGRGAPASAQQVTVRGGEHANFTRLVLNLPEGTAWDLRTLEAEAVLIWSKPGVELDLSATFARIPRTRLRDVTRTDGGALRLDLACACPLRAFEDLPGLLVIDILDPTIEGSDRATAPTGASDAARTAGRVLADTLRRRAAHDDPDLTAGSELEARLSRDLAAALEAAFGETVIADRGNGTVPLDKAHEDALANGTFASRNMELPPPTQTQTATADTVPVLADEMRSQIRVGPPEGESADLASHCLEPETLALESWGDGRSFDAQLAQARARLLGEFDRPDPQSVSALARLYLHFGFGAEVRALMRAFPVAVPDADLLRTLSFIVDEAVPPHPGRLERQADCPTSAALWAMLAVPEEAELTGLDVAALRRAFSALPGHQRRALGPAVVARLLARGETDAARVVAESALRASGGKEAAAALDLALARVALVESEGDTRRPPPRLPSPSQSPEALVLLLESMAIRREVPDRYLAETAGVLAVEHRGTPLGYDLIRAQAVALAAAGAHGEAFATAAKLAPDAPEAFSRLRTELFAALAKDATDMELVATMFTERPWTGPVLSGETWLALGQRMSELGFPAHARLMLQGDAPELRSVTATLALIESDIREGKTREAARALATVPQDNPETAAQVGALNARIAALGIEAAARSGVVDALSPAPRNSFEATETGASLPSATIAPGAIGGATMSAGLAIPEVTPASDPGDEVTEVVVPSVTALGPRLEPSTTPVPTRLPTPAPTSASEASTRLPSDAPAATPKGTESVGLLSQSRAALVESTALRASIESMLQAASGP